MKYTININQRKIVDLAPNLDIVDCAIMDYLYIFCNSTNEEINKRRIELPDGTRWTWIDYQKLVDDMPLLRLKKNALTSRLKRLVSSGLIESKLWQGKRQFIRFTDKIDSVFTEISSRNHVDDFQKSPRRTNNNIKDNNTRDKQLTNVSWGNPDINEGMLLLKTQVGAVSKEKLNRYALNRLYKSRGKDRTLKVMAYALAQRGQPYAPVITNYLELENKWANLEAFAVRQKEELKGGRRGIDASNL